MDTTAAEKDQAKDKKMATVKEESEDDGDMDELDMDAFLRDGGFEEDKKKRKKEEEAAANNEPTNLPEVPPDTDPDENMSGYLNMTKSKLDNKKEGFSVQNLVSVDKLASGLVSGVGSIAKLGLQGAKILGQKNFFAIKKGIMY